MYHPQFEKTESSLRRPVLCGGGSNGENLTPLEDLGFHWPPLPGVDKISVSFILALISVLVRMAQLPGDSTRRHHYEHLPATLRSLLIKICTAVSEVFELSVLEDSGWLFGYT